MRVVGPVSVEEIRAPGDRFRCVPYHAVLLASACVARQLTATAQSQQDRAWRGGDRINGDYEQCRACALGRQVAARLESDGGAP